MNKPSLLGYAYPPLQNELRSSWLRRLAYANDGNFQSFCHRLYGRTRLWLLDIDCLDDPALESALSVQTVASHEQIKQTSLLSFQGNLVGNIRTGGRGRFILPSNALLTRPDNPGIQWCPLCLDEKEAYWRKQWRLSFVTVCAKHKCVLADRCSNCGACARPIRRGDLRCWRCGYDARHHPLQSPDLGVMQLQEHLLDQMNANSKITDDGPLKFVESHNVLTFRVLWILMRLVSGGEKSGDLREILKCLIPEKSPKQHIPNIKWRVESQGVNARHFIMINVNALVCDWPKSFATICQVAGLVWSDLLRGIDERDLPFRYRELLLKEFYPNLQSRSTTFNAKYT